MTAASRARSPWSRRAVTTLVTLIVLAAAAGALAAATSRNSGRAIKALRAPARPAATVAPPAARRPRPSARRSPPVIDRVLRYTPVVSGGTPRRRAIALTFDDGPSPYTAPIVGVLSRMHAHATFFIVGQQLIDFAGGLRDELRHGFEIGDHTENHAWLIRLGAAQQYSQIHAAALAAHRLGAPLPRLLRPPYGAFNQTTLAVLHGLRMLAVMWSVDPGDWRRPGTRAIVRSVLSAARPGAIVELHDGGGDRSETLAALPAIINGLRRRHYEFVTVSELLAIDPPPRHQRLPGTGGA